MLAARSARRWLARYAAGVKLVRSPPLNTVTWTTPACAGLVSCLPALETAALQVPEPLDGEDFGRLLEALACCTRLTALHLCMTPCAMDGKGRLIVCVGSDTPAFAKLHSLAKLRGLTKLGLAFGMYDYPPLADVVDAISPLTGLTELFIRFDDIYETAVVPAALGQLKGLQSLKLDGLAPGDFEAGCFDLPNLVSLKFERCNFFPEVEVLPGISSMQSLTCIEFTGGQGPHFFDPQLVQLPRLQRMVFESWDRGARQSRLPAAMGSLSSALLHLDFNGQRFAHFPHALTQLVALECLNARENDFVDLPAAITALSRLTELSLGRFTCGHDPLQECERLPLDVRALGDLSAFPGLCALNLQGCEVKLCESLPGAARHSNLASLSFELAHPAPECLLMVLQLGQALKRLRQRSVLKFVEHLEYGEQCRVQQLPPFHKFKAASVACGL